MVFAIAKENAKEIKYLTRSHNSKKIEGAIAYIKITGDYSSYEGLSWNGIVKLVKPKEYTVLEFD